MGNPKTTIKPGNPYSREGGRMPSTTGNPSGGKRGNNPPCNGVNRGNNSSSNGGKK